MLISYESLASWAKEGREGRDGAMLRLVDVSCFEVLILRWV